MDLQEKENIRKRILRAVLSTEDEYQLEYLVAFLENLYPLPDKELPKDEQLASMRKLRVAAECQSPRPEGRSLQGGTQAALTRGHER